MSKKKSRKKHDPLWAKAKKVCRLNQDDIAMAKELGIGPRALMKNNPSPTQRWKLPVKQWIRELHEKRFGSRRPKAAGHNPKAKQPIPISPSFEWDDEPLDEEDPWDTDDEAFHDFAGAMLPQVEFFTPLEYAPDDDEWQQLRLGRRQKNLCWTACSLAAHFREVEAVDFITVFGSVATSVRRPFGQPWDGPDALAVCHTLNLALWVTEWDDATLCTLSLIVRQTLASLADVERIAFGDERLELILLDSATDAFLGRLRLATDDGALPSLEMPSNFVFRLEPLIEPQAVILFERSPADPPSRPPDDDIPF